MKNIGKKKLLLIMGAMVGIVVLIVIILLIYNAIFGKTTYQDIENKVVNAAKKYYSENQKLLPNNDSEEVSITDTDLTSAGYLDSMSKLTSKMNVNCSATVLVSYAGGNYRYTPLLDCGSDYSSKTFSSYIQDTVGTKNDGSGLYELNKELVYRGENPDNFVKFANHMWRIVKVEDNQVMMIFNDRGEKTVWDDRFNNDRNRTEGINNYRVSRIYENLLSMYENNTLIQKDYKNLLAAHDLYIGKRSEEEIINNGSIEKSKLIENQYIGLLPLYDYFNASIDDNCKNAFTYSCSNYNYLNYYGYTWWTITAHNANTYMVFRVDDYGTVEAVKAISNGYIRPIIYLAKDVLYAGGTGTETDPYTVK